MEKTTAFIPVRLSSSRFHRKHFNLIGSRSLLSWVVKRLKDSESFDEIVACIPQSSDCKEMREFCHEEEIQLFVHTGNEEDVMQRMLDAAETFNSKWCLLASGDCPLLDPGTITRCLDALKAHPESGYLLFKEIKGRLPIHEGLVIAKKEAWKEASALTRDSQMRKHQFPVMYRSPETMKNNPPLYHQEPEMYYKIQHRLSVDTAADLKFHNTIYSELEKKGISYNLSTVLELLIADPDLLKINETVYQIQIEDHPRSILFFLPSDQSLNIAFKYAKVATDRFGFGVYFVSPDLSVCEKVKEQGFLSFKKQVNQLDEVLSKLTPSMIFSTLSKELEKQHFPMDIPHLLLDVETSNEEMYQKILLIFNLGENRCL